MSKPKLLKIFDDITDDVAYSKLNNPITVTKDESTLLVSNTIQLDGDVILTFKSPCNGTEVSSIKINGLSYTLVDAVGNATNTVSNVFASGSYISVLVDTVDKKAYIQNSANNPTLDALYIKKLDSTSNVLATASI